MGLPHSAHLHRCFLSPGCTMVSRHGLPVPLLSRKSTHRASWSRAEYINHLSWGPGASVTTMVFRCLPVCARLLPPGAIRAVSRAQFQNAECWWARSQVGEVRECFALTGSDARPPPRPHSLGSGSLEEDKEAERNASDKKCESASDGDPALVEQVIRPLCLGCGVFIEDDGRMRRNRCPSA